MTETRKGKTLLWCAVGLITLTALDLWSKDWAEKTLSRQRATPITKVCEPDASGDYYMQRMRTDSIVLIKDHLELRYAENCGAAFGLLDEAPRWVRVGVFMVAGTFAIIALLWMFVHGHGGTLFAWSVPLIVSGALGNMVDRLRLGYVVDFIHFHTEIDLNLFFYHLKTHYVYPTFNIADSTITVGVVLLLLDGLRAPAAAPKPSKAPA